MAARNISSPARAELDGQAAVRTLLTFISVCEGPPVQDIALSAKGETPQAVLKP